jgi:DNA-binding transcriptional ArsR family regulator
MSADTAGMSAPRHALTIETNPEVTRASLVFPCTSLRIRVTLCVMAIDYTGLYTSAKAELLELEGRKAELLRGVDELDRQSVALRRTMNAIAPLIGEEIVPEPKLVEESVGMTERVRHILARSRLPLLASEIRDRLEENGLSMSSYSNPMATVHTVLRRLTEAGQAKASVEGTGTKRFAIVGSVMPLTQDLGVEKIAGRSFAIGKMKGFVGVGRLTQNKKSLPVQEIPVDKNKA